MRLQSRKFFVKIILVKLSRQFGVMQVRTIYEIYTITKSDRIKLPQKVSSYLLFAMSRQLYLAIVV